MAAGLVVGSILGGLIQGGFDLYAQSKMEKQAKEQNKILGEQYESERADLNAMNKWQQMFATRGQNFTEHQQNLANMNAWAKNFEDTVNKNQALKNNLLAVWNKSRSF